MGALGKNKVHAISEHLAWAPNNPPHVCYSCQISCIRKLVACQHLTIPIGCTLYLFVNTCKDKQTKPSQLHMFNLHDTDSVRCKGLLHFYKDDLLGQLELELPWKSGKSKGSAFHQLSNQLRHQTWFNIQDGFHIFGQVLNALVSALPILPCGASLVDPSYEVKGFKCFFKGARKCWRINNNTDFRQSVSISLGLCLG